MSKNMGCKDDAVIHSQRDIKLTKAPLLIHRNHGTMEPFGTHSLSALQPEGCLK